MKIQYANERIEYQLCADSVRTVDGLQPRSDALATTFLTLTNNEKPNIPG